MAPIETPTHDAENGYGGFTSLIFNRNPHDQLRFVGQLRTDYYQIPYDPNPSDWENQLYDSSGLRDGEHETDGISAFSWIHTLSASSLFEISPFYHYNDANYQPNANDLPTATNARQTGQYTGAQAYFSTTIARNSLKAGLYGYGQHENDLFGAVFNDGSAPNFSETSLVNGGVEEAFIEDNYRPTSWLTLIGGERQTHFQAAISENAIYPRIGIGGADSETRLGLPRLLRPLLPAAAAHQPLRPRSRLRAVQQHQLRPAARRARRGAPVRPPDSLARLAPRRRHLPDPRQQFPRPQQHRRVQHLHPRHRAGRAHPGMGAHPALATPLALRPGPPRLLQPDRPADRPHHRRPHLLSARSHPPAPSRPAIRPSTTTSATRSTSASTAICPAAPTPLSTSTTARASPTAIQIRHRPTPATTCPRTPPSIWLPAKRSAKTGRSASTPSTSPTPVCCSTTASPSAASMKMIHARSTGRFVTVFTSRIEVWLSPLHSPQSSNAAAHDCGASPFTGTCSVSTRPPSRCSGPGALRAPPQSVPPVRARRPRHRNLALYVADRLLDSRSARYRPIARTPFLPRSSSPRVPLRSPSVPTLLCSGSFEPCPPPRAAKTSLIFAASMLYFAIVHLPAPAACSAGSRANWPSASSSPAPPQFPPGRHSASPHTDLALPVLLFAGLCSLNCLAIETWEQSAAQSPRTLTLFPSRH